MRARFATRPILKGSKYLPATVSCSQKWLAWVYMIQVRIHSGSVLVENFESNPDVLKLFKLKKMTKVPIP